MVNLLLRHNAAVDDRTFSSTPLSLAASLGLAAISARLLEHGANVNATTQLGWTALHLAALQGQEACVKVSDGIELC